MIKCSQILPIAAKLAAVAALLIAGFATPASAASTSSRKVVAIETTSAGSVYVHFDGNLNGATCANKDMLYFDATTAAGKNFLSMMTSAFLASRTVSIDYSSASCVSNTHTLKWMNIY